MIDFYRRRPRIAWTLTGAPLGALIGLVLLGNFGVAGSSGAFGVWGWLLLGIVGAYVGFRFGEWRSRRAS